MDPNFTLDQIRELVADFTNETADMMDGHQLAEYINGLDEWLSKGGFPPTDWAANR